MNRKNLIIFFFFLLVVIIINGLNTETYFTTEYIVSAETTNNEIIDDVLVYFPIIMINNNTFHDVYNQEPDIVNPDYPITELRVTPTEKGNYLLSSKPWFYREGNNFRLSYDLRTVTEGTDTISFESYNSSSNQIYFKVLAKNDTIWKVGAELQVTGFNRLKFYNTTLIQKVPTGYHPYSRFYQLTVPPEKIGQWVGLTVPQEISLTKRSAIFYRG